MRHSIRSTHRVYLTAVKAHLEARYVGFGHLFTVAIAISAMGGSTGGYGVLTGVEGGQVDGERYYGTDGAFAVGRIG